MLRHRRVGRGRLLRRARCIFGYYEGFYGRETFIVILGSRGTGRYGSMDSIRRSLLHSKLSKVKAAWQARARLIRYVSTMSN